MLFFIFFSTNFYSQSYYEWDSYTVDEFYSRVDLDYGTLDQYGNQIDYIYVITSINAGTYEVEITEADGDLYEIKGVDIYLSFVSYYGYAGYGDEGILEVSQYGSATFYKKE